MGAKGEIVIGMLVGLVLAAVIAIYSSNRTTKMLFAAAEAQEEYIQALEGLLRDHDGETHENP